MTSPADIIAARLHCGHAAADRIATVLGNPDTDDINTLTDTDLRQILEDTE